MLVPAAELLATEAHAGQTRRHGAPYVNHPRAVATLVDDLGAACGIDVDDHTRAAAWLHDTVEDCADVSVERVRAGFGAEVATAVDLLTKRGKGEAATTDYYARLAAEASTSTKLIKVCDRLHNLSELRFAPDERKLRAYVDETRTFIVPLAAAVHPGLVAALEDAIANATANQQVAPSLPSRARSAQSMDSGIYAIVHPAAAHGLSWSQRLDVLLAGGVARVQLRIKPGDLADDRAAIALLLAARAQCQRYGVPLVVNDRADLAFAASADGVHVGDRDVPPSVVRRIVGPRALIGTSTHSFAQCLAACRAAGVDDVDHVALGPLWLSPTKQGHADVVGIDVLAAVAAETAVPLVGIGGIGTPARAAEVARAGAAFAAVVSAFDNAAVDDEIALYATVRRFVLAFVAARAARPAAVSL